MNLISRNGSVWIRRGRTGLGELASDSQKEISLAQNPFPLQSAIALMKDAGAQRSARQVSDDRLVRVRFRIRGLRAARR